MPTGAQLVEDARAHLQAYSRDELNRTTADPGAAGTTLAVEFAVGGIQRGVILAVDLELMYVWSVTALNVTVQRGVLGSTATTHAVGSLVYVNPRFPAFRIFSEINNEIRSYSSPAHGLFRISTVDLTGSITEGYDLTGVTSLIDILEVRYQDYGAEARWPLIRQWSLARNMPTASFASGFALMVDDAPAIGRTIRVRYKAAYTAFTALSQDLTTQTGMHDEASDIPPLGAAARLLAAREARRASYDAQPESRRAEDVPPGTNRQAAAGLLALRDMRLREEAARLSSQYPHLRKVI